jgi:hypothetical protein
VGYHGPVEPDTLALPVRAGDVFVLCSDGLTDPLDDDQLERIIAGTPLDDLAEVTDRAKVIKRVVTEGTMPPWFAVLEPGAETNPWANDCSLSVRDKTDLIAWIDSKDRPLGDPAEAPAPRVYPEEWSIGTPDLIVPLSRAYDIKADGFMPYAFDVVQTELTEDRWVKAFRFYAFQKALISQDSPHILQQSRPSAGW